MFIATIAWVYNTKFIEIIYIFNFLFSDLKCLNTRRRRWGTCLSFASVRDRSLFIRERGMGDLWWSWERQVTTPFPSPFFFEIPLCSAQITSHFWFLTFFSIPRDQVPVQVAWTPVSQGKNKPITIPILPLQDPLIFFLDTRNIYAAGPYTRPIYVCKEIQV